MKTLRLLLQYRRHLVESGPSLVPFWAVVPSGAINLIIKAVSSDGNPVTFSWGDGTETTVNSNTNTTKAYAGAGTYPIALYEPDRITEIVTAGVTAALNGAVDITLSGAAPLFPNLTKIQIIRRSITNITGLDLYPSIDTVSVADNSMDAAAIDAMLIALDSAVAGAGLLDYSGNPGSADLDRSPEAAMAKARLSGKGWLIVS